MRLIGLAVVLTVGLTLTPPPTGESARLPAEPVTRAPAWTL